MKKYISTVFAAIAVVTAQSQELKEAFTVEGQYIPDVIRQDKIHTFPARLDLKADINVPQPGLKGIVTSYSPDITALPTTGWLISRLPSKQKGYLDFGVGSFLDITASAGYRFLDTDKISAGIMFQHNSTSLFKPHQQYSIKDEKRYRYDETLGLYGSWSPTEAGTLSAEAYWHGGFFNYYGLNAPSLPELTPEKFPTQTLNDIYISAKWESDQTGKFVWDSKAYYRYFGYRAAYYPWYEKFRGTRESTAGISANTSYKIDSSQSVGAAIRMNLATYNDDNTSDIYFTKPDTYGNISLTPFYEFNPGNASIRIGANVDLTINAGEKGNRYSRFHIAPAIRMGWQNNGFGLYLDVDGGTQMQTLAYLYESDYYHNPRLTSTMPVYTPVNAKAGFTFFQTRFLHADVHIRYRYSKDTRLGGWYMASLGYCDRLSVPEGMFADLLNGTTDLKGYSLGATLKSKPLANLDLYADINWQPQNGNRGFFNGYDRPRWELDTKADIQITNTLSAGAAYQYRGVRRIYAACHDRQGENKLISTRLPDICMINLDLSWHPYDNLTIWGAARNLLGKKTDYLPCQPEEGFNFQIGCGLIF